MRPLPPLLLIVLLLAACGDADRASAPAEPPAAEAAPAIAPEDEPPLYADPLLPAGRVVTETFRRGDNLDLLLRRAGLPGEERVALERALGRVFDLGAFRAGRELVIRLDDRGRAVSLIHPLDYLRDLCAWRDGDGFAARVFTTELEWTRRLVRAELIGSFYESLQSQGEDGDLATRVADLFAGEVDFFFDLRPGDRMEMLLDSARRPDRNGPRDRVLAARLIISGEVHEAFLHPAADGTRHYYHRDGGSLERRFLKAPLNYTRVSSNFNRNRLHPVLKTHRPHNGVDYAAPVGTPVRATADGTVCRRTYQRGGAGRYLSVRHPGGIQTTYMHLSRYAGGTAVGSRVRKGQVIGFVGSSGLSTGPHLDYRIQIDGRFVNPRTFQSDSADPLAEDEMPAFLQVVAGLDASWRELQAHLDREDADNATLARAQEAGFRSSSADTISSAP